MSSDTGNHPRRHILSALATGLVATLLVAGGAFYFIFATHAGLLVLCDAARDYFGSEFSFSAVHGRLEDHFEIDNLRISRADGVHISVDRLNINWSPADLLEGQLHLNAVELEKLSVERPSSSGKPRKWPAAVPKIPNLPIAGITIGSLNITDLMVHNPGRPAIHIGRIHFSGNWEGRNLQIKSLSMDIPNVGPIAIHGNLDGEIRGVHIHYLRLSGPGSITISGTIGYGATSSHLRIRWHNLKWPLTGHRHPEVSHVDGTARITGNLSRYNCTATGHLALARQPISIALEFHGNRQGVRFTHIRADAGKLGLFAGHAQIAWHTKRQASAEIQISQGNLDPLIPSLKSRINGQLKFSLTQANNGPLATFALHVAHSTVRGHSLTLNLAGLVDHNRGKLTALDAHVLGGTLRGSGLIRWSGPLTGHLTLQIRNIRPRTLHSHLPGHLNGEFKFLLTTRKDSERNVAFFGMLDHSAIRGAPLHLNAVGHVSLLAGHRPKVDLRRLSAKLGKTRLSISGRASQPLDIKGQFQSQDLSAFSPELGGQLAFDFQLRGSLKNFELKTHGQGHDLRHGKYRIGSLRWTAKLDPLKPSTLRIKIRQAAYSGIRLSSGEFDVQGIERHQQIRLRLVAPRGIVHLKLAGGYNQRQREWHGKISSLQLSPTGMPNWNLDKKPDLAIGKGRLILGLTCLKSQSGRLCFRLQRVDRPPEVKVYWSMINVHLAPLKALLSRNGEVAGQLRGQGHIQWIHGNISDARGNLTLSNARLRFGKAPPLDIHLGHLTVMQQHLGTLRGSLKLVSPQGTIDAQITLAPGTLLVRRSLHGSVDIKIPHLDFLESYLTDVKQLDGRINGAMSLGGTLAKPRVGGQLTLTAGRAHLTKAGITLSDVSFHATGHEGTPVHVAGQASSGGGRLQFQGTLNPSQSPDDINLRVKGENFQAMNTLDGRIWINPDLKIVRNLQGVHLNGTIFVPKAILTPRGGLTNQQGVAPSPDQVIVGHQKNGKTNVPAVFANLVVRLGKAVRFKGYGLTARVTGQVAVNEVPQRLPTAQGRLQLIGGRYSAYGQKLILKKGELIFDGGPVTEPAIDILAVRKPREGIEVGVRVRGHLNQPRLSLTSTPPMRREEQLSWLIFGHPLSESSNASQGAIAGAALALGLSGGNYLANQIGKTLGIGKLSIGTNTQGGSAVAAQPQTISGAEAELGSTATAGSEAAQLTLGKYLTPRLYVSYGVGLVQASQAFRLRYKLGHGLELQTESGVSTGGDLIYTFEGGK